MGLETALLGILAATSVGSAAMAYGQAKESKKAARSQEASAAKLAEDEEKERLQSIMRAQKRKGATGEPGTRDTILTGPLGVPGQPQTGGKTLLGL